MPNLHNLYISAKRKLSQKIRNTYETTDCNVPADKI